MRIPGGLCSCLGTSFLSTLVLESVSTLQMQILRHR